MSCVFGKLDTIPYGFHVDEVGSAVTVQCFAEKGCDAELTPWPLFGFMEYGQDKPPTYVYPGMLWAKMFGATVPSLRAYSVFVLLIGMLGLFFLSQAIFRQGFWGGGCFGGHLFAMGMGRYPRCHGILFCPGLCHLGSLFFLAFLPLVGLGAGRFPVCLCHVYLSARKITSPIDDGNAGSL